MSSIKKIALFSVLSITALTPLGFVLSCSNNEETPSIPTKIESMKVYFSNTAKKQLQVEIRGQNLPSNSSKVSITIDDIPITPLSFATPGDKTISYFSLPFNYDFNEKRLIYQIKDTDHHILKYLNFKSMTDLDPEHPTTFSPKLTSASIEQSQDDKAILKITGEDLPFDIYQRIVFQGPEGLQKSDWTLKYFNYDQIILEQPFNYTRFNQKFIISIENTDSSLLINYPRSTRSTTLESLSILENDIQNITFELRGKNFPSDHQDFQLFIDDQKSNEMNIISSSFDTLRFSLKFDPSFSQNTIKVKVKDKFTQEILSIDSNQKYPITPASITSMEILEVPLLHTTKKTQNYLLPTKTMRQLLIKGEKLSDRLGDFNFFHKGSDISSNGNYKISALKDADGSNIFRIDYLIDYETSPSLDDWAITLKGKEDQKISPILSKKDFYEDDKISLGSSYSYPSKKWLDFKIKNFEKLINAQGELVIPAFVDFDGFTIPIQMLDSNLITNLKWEGELPKPSEGQYNIYLSQTRQLPFSKIVLPETIFSVSNNFFNTKNSYRNYIDNVNYNFEINWDFSNIELVLPETNNIYSFDISNLFNNPSINKPSSFKQISQKNKEIIQFSNKTFNLNLTGSNISKIDISQMSSSAKIILANSKIEGIDLPSTWTNIPASMFKNTNLSSITLPQDLETIGDYAFYNTKISSITLPSKLKSIGSYAFYNTKIASLIIPASVQIIDSYAFYQNPISSLTFAPNSLLESIGSYAFYYSKLTQLNLPSKLKTIGSSAFYSNQITSLTLPSSLTTIEESAFSYNKIAGHITIPNPITKIGSYSFKSNQITQLTLPDNLVEIGYSAFENNQITNVNLPSKLTKLNPYAFSNNKLTTIDLTNIKSIGQSAFYNNKLTSLTIPEAITEIPSSAFASNQITTLNLPNKLKTIGESAFADNKELGKQLKTLPDSITKISDFAFKNCNFTSITLPKALEYFSGFDQNNLTSITLPETITTIGRSALANNINIPSITIPDAVVSIMPNAFQNLKITSATLPSKIEYLAGFNGTLISDIIIPESVTTIGYDAFYKTKISSITLPNKLKTIESNAFASTDISQIGFPDSLTSIGSNAFKETKLISISKWSSKLQKIDTDAFASTLLDDNGVPELPSTLTYLSGFRGTEITKIPTIPTSVSTIGQYAFSSTKITSVNIPSHISRIDYSAFSNNDELSSVTFDPNSRISTLSQYTFSNNKSLTSITIPDTITTIDSYCFYKTPLKSINFPPNLIEIDNSAFEDTDLSGEITIPKTIKRIYSWAFRNTAITKLRVPKELPLSYTTNLFNKNNQGEQINKNNQVVEIIRY